MRDLGPGSSPRSLFFSDERFVRGGVKELFKFGRIGELDLNDSGIVRRLVDFVRRRLERVIGGRDRSGDRRIKIAHRFDAFD